MAAKKYYTSKHGTKIDITGLTDAQVAKVKSLADAKRGGEATTFAKDTQAKLAKSNSSKTGTGDQGNTTTTTDNTVKTAGDGAGDKGLAANIDPNTPGLNEDDAKAMERIKGILRIGEEYGRGLADEFYKDGSLGRVQETNSPEELAALEQIKQFASTVGNQTDQVKGLIDQQQGILTDAQKYSALEQEAADRSRASLEGLAAPEMEALRSQARANIQGELQAGLRDMAKSQARNQVFGAAATAQQGLLNRQGVVESRNLERDLLVKNIDIKQAAQQQFNNLVTGTEANRAQRTNAASGQLSSTTLGDEQQRNSAKNTAIANQGNMATTLADKVRALQQYNLGQVAAEKAGKVGSIIGGIGTVTGQRGLLAGENFADQQYSDSQSIQDEILKIIKGSLSSGKSALG
jgi:hypothetical protein